MSETLTLEALPREGKGTAGARATRREGRVPAIVYGGGEPGTKISLEERALLKQLNNNPTFFNAIVEVAIEGGETLRALPREVQLHPVTDRPLHLDLLKIGKDTTVTVGVPVVFLNEDACPGLKKGGVLNVVRYEVELVCPAESIPANIEVDLTPFEVGESVHISAATLPAGVKTAIQDRDFTVATIQPPTTIEDIEAEGEEVTETEVITEADDDAKVGDGADGDQPEGDAKEGDKSE